MDKCVDHLEFVNAVCEDCKLPVDAYGNTENQFDNCAYPDCGCDGARLCMAANGASDRSVSCNAEGMYRTKDGKARMRAAMDILGEKHA